MPPVELPAADPAATLSPAPTEVRAAPPAAPPAADPTVVRLHGDELFQFVEDAHVHGVRADQIRTWATTLTPDAARTALLRHLGEEQRSRTSQRPAHSAARVTLDERDTARTAITSALLHRHNPRNELHEAGREYRGMSLLEMARRNLERNGEKTSGLGRREVAELALRTHSTSDFPNILSNVAGRTLRSGYEASVQTFKAWMRRASVPDFRQVSRLQLGGAPNFLLVPEGGEFKMGTLGEGKEVYAIATYGRRFAVTRQVIVNDDLDAFTRIPEMWGRAAADFESDAAYAPLITNPNMGDGNPLFSTGAGNQAGAGGAISETTVQAAEVGLGSQVGLEGRPINVQPKWLITAVKDRVPGQKLLRSTDAAGAQGTVNVYQNAMTQIVEARLNRVTGPTPWFVAADNAQVDTIEYAYLEGDDGVFLDERVGFEVDGIEYKARLDFGVKAIDRRGLYQNPGL